MSSLGRVIISGFALSSVCVLGTIGNILSVFVLSRPEMRVSINCLLRVLAICDAVYLLALLSNPAIPVLSIFIGFGQNYRDVLYPVIRNWVGLLTNFGSTASTYFVIAITVERYIAVCHPFRAKTLCTWSKACWTSFAIVVLSFTLALPVLFVPKEEGLIIANNLNNMTRMETHTELNTRRDYRIWPKRDAFAMYEAWTHLIFNLIIPCTILLILNSLIYKAIMKHQVSHRKLTNQGMTTRPSRQELNSFTKIQICIVLTFGICYLLNFCVLVFDFFRYHPRFFGRLTDISLLLTAINSALNFIIYCVMGQKFRQSFCQMLSSILQGLSSCCKT